MSTPTPDVTTNYGLPLPHPANEGTDDCLRLRQALTGVDAVLKSVADSADEKADAADVASSIATAREDVTADLALKADVSALDLKADSATIDAALALKANIATVNDSLNLKADTSTVNTALELKADTTTMNAALNLKADAATNTAAHENLATEIEAAKGKATWDGLVGKPSSFPPSAHKHPVGDVTGVLPIANGGTGRADGKAVALATARTISLAGGVTGSTNFDGSANVNIAATLATANASTLGGVKLLDAVNSTSSVTSGVAATPAAVKTVYDRAETKLPLTGGTLSGNLVLPAAGLHLRVADTQGAEVGTLRNFAPMRGYGGDVNGIGIAVTGNGLTVIGGGESANTVFVAANLTELGVTPSAEQLINTSDGDILFLTGAQTWANKRISKIKATGEVVIGNGDSNKLRLVQENYGAFFRVDGSNLYLMLTASGDQEGTYTSARPLTVNLASGVCNINGSAATATKLQTARNIVLSGDVTGSVNFDGSGNVAIATKIAASGHYHVYVDAVNGVDTKDGKSWANAVKTLNAALRIMSPQADQNAEKIIYIKGTLSLSSLSLSFGMYRFVGVNDANDVQACFSLTGTITLNCVLARFDNINITSTSTSIVLITNNNGALDIRGNTKLTGLLNGIAINNKAGSTRVADSSITGGIKNHGGEVDVRNTQFTYNNPNVELFANIGGYFHIQDNITFLNATGKCFIYSPTGVFAISTAITYSGTFSGMKYDLVGHGLIDTGGRGTASIAGNRSGGVSEYGKVR